MGATDNLERQKLLKEFDKKIKNFLIKKPKKFSIREAIKLGMPPLLMNKGGIVARTKSKFKGHF
tara:strand:- start:731 stop:922 length:192 start_codon:yes stop_codon:yes gene_type:complete